MKAQLIYTDKDDRTVIGSFIMDADDALSTAKILLKLKKAKKVFIQTSDSRFSYYVSMVNKNYVILGTTKSNI